MRWGAVVRSRTPLHDGESGTGPFHNPPAGACWIVPLAELHSGPLPIAWIPVGLRSAQASRQLFRALRSGLAASRRPCGSCLAALWAGGRSCLSVLRAEGAHTRSGGYAAYQKGRYALTQPALAASHRVAAVEAFVTVAVSDGNRAADLARRSIAHHDGVGTIHGADGRVRL